MSARAGTDVGTSLESFDTFADAIQGSLRRLLNVGQSIEPVRDPTSVATNFGERQRPTIELIGHGFEIRDPRSIAFVHPSRRLRVPFAFGNLLWTWLGSDAVSWIDYYNRRAASFSDDGTTLRGSFGKRLARHKQLDAVVARLRRDASTRRTVAVIAASDDVGTTSRDYPCCIATQYLLRDEQLTSITYMRSQSALGVLPYDVFLFASIHCAIAAELGVEPGPYRHFSTSFHIYDDELSAAQELVQLPPQPVRVGTITGFGALDALVETERHIRVATDEHDVTQLLEMLPSESTAFEAQARITFIVEALCRLGSFDGAEKACAMLPADLANLTSRYLENRGPNA